MSSIRRWPREARRRASEWTGQFWSDVRASVDPGLLAAARFLGLLYGRIDRDVTIDEALRKALRRRLPAHVGWRHAFGGITHLLFMVLVVTGVLLCVYYRPSAEEAYASIQFIVSEVTLGWLLRDLHAWTANLIVIAALAHMARVFFEGAYKPPRETSWFVGLLLLLVVLSFGATGYLLPWDQWAYWTVAETLGAVEAIPLLGAPLAGLLRGDEFVSGATVSRFFVIHAIVLPWLALALLVFHFAVLRKHGPAPPVRETGRTGRAPAEGTGAPVEAGRPAADRKGRPASDPGSATDEERTGIPFFPHHLLRSFIVSVLVLGLALTLAIWFPRPVAPPATPSEVPEALVSTWIVVDVTRGLLHYLGPWGLAAFTLLGVALALLPLFDRSPGRWLRDRRAAVALGVLFFAGFAVAWLAGRGLESPPPSPPPLEERVPAGGESAPGTEGAPVEPGLGPAPIRPAPEPEPGASPGGEGSG